eukprot:COSAG02_NODE_561_length_20308_cov_42.799495_6_plen_87_part_00
MSSACCAAKQTLQLGSLLSILCALTSHGVMRTRSCFQMNGLLGMALEALGMEVARLLCKVRWNKAPDEETTFTHIALRVTLPNGER